MRDGLRSEPEDIERLAQHTRALAEEFSERRLAIARRRDEHAEPLDTSGMMDVALSGPASQSTVETGPAAEVGPESIEQGGNQVSATSVSSTAVPTPGSSPSSQSPASPQQHDAAHPGSAGVVDMPQPTASSSSYPQPRPQQPATLSRSNASSAPSSTGQQQAPQPIQSLFSERGERLEREREAREAKEKAERRAIARAKREAEAAESSAAADPSKKTQMSYAAQQRQREREARYERERIKKQIENDRQARKERDEQARLIRRGDLANAAQAAVGAQPAAVSPRKGPASTECAVQVRLMDGSTIRSRFPCGSNIRADIRPWIDAELGGVDTPYTLKQILTPLPNRPIEVGEEEESLQSLGLTPTATLVLVPVEGAAEAYGNGPGWLPFGFRLVSSGVATVMGLGAFLGLGQHAPPSSSSATATQQRGGDTGSLARPGSGGATASLQDLRDRRQDGQLYNGNSVRARSVGKTGSEESQSADQSTVELRAERKRRQRR